MAVLGIVAEYDPLHNGHLYHLNEAKSLVKPDLTYVVLSPCMKQRGDLPLLSPLDRARLALEAGADAVFALPVLWTVRDAEHYALGAVSLLASLGVTHLAFGAETNDLPLLNKAAKLLESPAPSLRSALKTGLSSGLGFPAALSRAAGDLLQGAEALLSRPNNILAVSYLRAILNGNLKVEPVLIPRRGNYHAAGIDPDAPSASALREALLRGNYREAFAAVPDQTAGILRRRFLDRNIPDDRTLDTILLYRLRSMTTEEYASLPDLSEGLENALRNAAVTARTRQELLDAVSCSRYPASRISRLCAYALLQVSRKDLASVPLPENALLLGLRKNPDMTARWKQLSLPVISSFTEWKKAAHPADLLAWRLWAQCCRLPATLPFSEKTVSL